jgi:hypothetical protein
MTSKACPWPARTVVDLALLGIGSCALLRSGRFDAFDGDGRGNWVMMVQRPMVLTSIETEVPFLEERLFLGKRLLEENICPRFCVSTTLLHRYDCFCYAVCMRGLEREAKVAPGGR